jgi:hypothetical protein
VNGLSRNGGAAAPYLGVLAESIERRIGTPAGAAPRLDKPGVGVHQGADFGGMWR